MVGRPAFAPPPAGGVSGSVQAQGDPDNLEVADDLAVRLLLHLVDEPVHRPGDAREVAAKPLAVAPRRHRRVVLRSDVDDAGHVADGSVVVGAVDGGDELVVQVSHVLVVLAVFVALVRLAVQKRDDERVLEPDLEGVGAGDHVARSGHEVVSEQRLAAGAVDQDVLGFQQPDRLLRRNDCRSSLDRARVPVVDQIADRALDGVERAEPCAHSRRRSIRSAGIDCLNASPSSSSRIEDGLDVVAVMRSAR